MRGIPGWYMQFGNWVLKLLILNMLWVMFTLVGLVVFGFFPATIALFAVIRKLVMQNDDAPIFKLFWNTYKSEFIKSNILGVLVLLIGVILSMDLYILRQLDFSIFNQLLIIIVFILMVVYIVLVMYIFPVFVHYDTNIKGYFKYAIILVIGRPFHTIFMIVCNVALIYFLWWIPGLIPVFGLSLFAFLIMKIASISLPKIKENEL